MLHRVGLLALISGGLAVSAVGVIWTALALDASLGWLVAGLVVTGMGLGAAMSVASTAIIGNVPVHRMGMASSVDGVSYEFGSLAAVSLLGSLLAGVYTTVVRLPEGAPGAARDSLDSAVSLAGRGSTPDAAFTAFDTGYVVVMIVVAVFVAVGACVTGVLLRRHGPRSSISVDAVSTAP